VDRLQGKRGVKGREPPAQVRGLIIQATAKPAAPDRKASEHTSRVNSEKKA